MVVASYRACVYCSLSYWIIPVFQHLVVECWSVKPLNTVVISMWWNIAAHCTDCENYQTNGIVLISIVSTTAFDHHYLHDHPLITWYWTITTVTQKENITDWSFISVVFLFFASLSVEIVQNFRLLIVNKQIIII